MTELELKYKFLFLQSHALGVEIYRVNKGLYQSQKWHSCLLRNRPLSEFLEVIIQFM